MSLFPATTCSCVCIHQTYYIIILIIICTYSNPYSDFSTYTIISSPIRRWACSSPMALDCDCCQYCCIVFATIIDMLPETKSTNIAVKNEIIMHNTLLTITSCNIKAQWVNKNVVDCCIYLPLNINHYHAFINMSIENTYHAY